MTVRFTVLLIAGWGFCISPGSAETRTFTDKFGREIEAEIVSVRPPNVSLKRADGKSFLLPIEKLSKADQAFVTKWREENPQIDLDYRFEKEKKASEGGGERRTEEWAYRITVTNRGYQDLEGLQIDYTIYKQLHDRYARDKRKLSGSLKSSQTMTLIESKRSAEFETRPIVAESVNKVTKKRSANGQFTDSTFEKWDEDLCGIRVTVKHLDKVVDTDEFGIVAEDDEPVAEVEKATRTSRSRNF